MSVFGRDKNITCVLVPLEGSTEEAAIFKALVEVLPERHDWWRDKYWGDAAHTHKILVLCRTQLIHVPPHAARAASSSARLVVGHAISQRPRTLMSSTRSVLMDPASRRKTGRRCTACSVGHVQSAKVSLTWDPSADRNDKRSIYEDDHARQPTAGENCGRQ